VRTKASSAGIDNIEVATASAVSLPLVDGTADLVVSNYCFHHLNDDGKRRALSEIYRVLEPGGRLVFGDMMFRLSMSHPRDRRAAGSGDRACAHRRPRDR
jgi:ubiquinone/menaquinone biosynthesis C-methylase UbiE